jgi:hypothetical protein
MNSINYIKNVIKKNIKNPYFINTNKELYKKNIERRTKIILFDWLFTICLKINELNYLIITFSIIEKYLSLIENIEIKNFQLIGITCLLISFKYNEDIYCKDIKYYLDYCDNCYTFSDIILMEKNILKKIDYNINIPTAYCYNLLYKKISYINIQQRNFYKLIIISYFFEENNFNLIEINKICRILLYKEKTSIIIKNKIELFIKNFLNLLDDIKKINYIDINEYYKIKKIIDNYE